MTAIAETGFPAGREPSLASISGIPSNVIPDGVCAVRNPSDAGTPILTGVFEKCDVRRCEHRTEVRAEDRYATSVEIHLWCSERHRGALEKFEFHDFHRPLICSRKLQRALHGGAGEQQHQSSKSRQESNIT
jgi:hypothetical protein